MLHIPSPLGQPLEGQECCRVDLVNPTGRSLGRSIGHKSTIRSAPHSLTYAANAAKLSRTGSSPSVIAHEGSFIIRDL